MTRWGGHQRATVCDPRRAFDFNCAKDELRYVKIDDRSLGVIGCKHKATYLKACTGPRFAEKCSWVLNGAIQDTSDDQDTADGEHAPQVGAAHLASNAAPWSSVMSTSSAASAGAPGSDQPLGCDLGSGCPARRKTGVDLPRRPGRAALLHATGPTAARGFDRARIGLTMGPRRSLHRRHFARARVARVRYGSGVKKLIVVASLVAACSSTAEPMPEPQPLPEGWSALAPLPVGVGELALAADGGTMYAVGGFDTRRDLQIYDAAADRWDTGAPLPKGTDNAGAIVIDGKLWVFGGEATPAVLIYDPASAAWTRGPALPSPRFASVVERIGGEVHLVGGWSHDRANNASLVAHDVFDVATGTYAAEGRAAAPTARNHATAGVIGGKLYVTGGRGPGHEAEDATNVTATEVYDPATDAWQALAPIPTARSGGASVVLDGKLYVLGGGLPGAEVSAVVERFDPADGTWERLGDMPEAATGLRAVAFEGAIYVFGGFVTANGARQGDRGSDRAWRFAPPQG